jgi:hypothetical protein
MNLEDRVGVAVVLQALEAWGCRQEADCSQTQEQNELGFPSFPRFHVFEN